MKDYGNTPLRYSKLSFLVIVEPALETAASIWFEIWGVADQQNFDFSRQISEKFQYFQAISQKISIFPGKF